MKILAINFGGIGDEILFLPTLQSLKTTYPDAEITLALEPRSRSVCLLTDIINNIINVKIKGKRRFFDIIKLIIKSRSGHYDIVVASGANKIISIILFLTGIKQRYGYDTGKLSRILLTKSIKLNKQQYAASMYHDLVVPLTGPTSTPIIPKITTCNVSKEPNTVLIHSGVSKLSIKKGIQKTLPPEKWAELIDLLAWHGKKVILTGGPDDEECLLKIKSHIKTDNYKDMSKDPLSLYDLAILISSCEKFICSDSAPMHIAVGVNTKTYAIFGPTDPKKLIPENGLIIPIQSDDNCPQKPCLWEKRKKTCKDCSCLNINLQKLAILITKD